MLANRMRAGLAAALMVGLAVVLAACGSQMSGSALLPTPHPAGEDELALVRHALITDVTTIQTSHRVVTTSTSPGGASAGGSVQFEADTKMPDTVYAKGSLNGEDFERLLKGDRLYRRDASGAWVQYTESDDAYMALVFALDYPYGLLKTALFPAEESPGIENPTLIDTGAEETFDGVRTKHFTWEISWESTPGQKQRYASEVWVDPAAKRAYRLLQCTYQEATGSSPASDRCWSVTISKFNEPVSSLSWNLRVDLSRYGRSQPDLQLTCLELQPRQRAVS